MSLVDRNPLPCFAPFNMPSQHEVKEAKRYVIVPKGLLLGI